MKKNSTAYKMHVKNGDVVKIISGKQKGEIGVVQQSFPTTGKIIVDRVNKKTKHNKIKQDGNVKGKITIQEYPIHSSNVKKWDQ